MKTYEQELERYFQTNLSNITLARCSNGDVNTTYLAKYQEGKAIVKLQRRSDLPSLYENQILREEIGTKLCIENGIVCPKIIASSQAEGFIITEFIDLPLLADVWVNIETAEQMRIKEQALSMINTMNHIKLSYFGALYQGGRIGQFGTWEQAFINIVDNALNDCSRYKALTKEECQRIMDRAQVNCLSLTKEQKREPVFAHLDFHWKNIFYDIEKHCITYLFDFGSAMSTVDYMGYYRLNGGFLYGTADFYSNEISCPIVISDAEKENAWLYNTLDYLTFLAFNGVERNAKEIVKIRGELGL